MAEIIYNPGYFFAGDLTAARRLMFAGEREDKVEKRWEKETPVMTELICRELMLKKNDLVLDYGCGIGRLSKTLCERGCRVIGVDPSPEMRKFAAEYVNMPDRFLVIPPEMLELLTSSGLKFDAAFAVWVLQHCPQPLEDLKKIFRSIKQSSLVFIANYKKQRAVPVNQGQWLQDGIDIWDLANHVFGLKNTILYPNDLETDASVLLCRTYMKTAGVI